MIKNHIVLSIIDIISLLFLFGLLYNDYFLSRKRKRGFSVGIIFTVLVIVAEVGTMLASGGSAELRVFNNFFNILGFAITPAIPIALIAFFDIGIIKKHKAFLIPTFLNVAAVILSPIFGLIFYVDAYNNYQRGTIFPFFMVVYLTNLILLVIITMYTGQKYFYPVKWKIASLSVFVVAGTCVQIVMPSVYSTWHCVTFSLFLFYIILSEFEGSFDTQTNLYNRKAFEKATARLKGKKKYAVIVLDINEFKEINDTFGHEYGDLILKDVATIINGHFGDRCSCYRIGGDEICIITKDTDLNIIEDQLKNMSGKFGNKCHGGRCLPLVAYGYSICLGESNQSFKEMFKEADQQMYNCKQLQKKTKVVY